MNMDTNELELLKKVLPDGYTIEPREGLRPRFLILDEEGEQFLQGVSTTAKGAVLELMEQSRRSGVIEGRYGKQREVLVALGVTELVETLREEMQDQIEKGVTRAVHAAMR